MVTLVRPDTGTPQSNAKISPNTATLAGRGSIATGEQMQQVASVMEQSAATQYAATAQLSSVIDQEGQRLFETSKKAHQSSTLLNKMTEATEQFLVKQHDRYLRSTDENGNPTFQTLHKDIEQIGTEILTDTASNITDPEVSQQFRANFGEYVANQKITALKQGLNQQVEFGQNSLKKGLNSLLNQSLNDDISQVPSYEQQGLEALRSAMAGGLISKDEFDSASASFSENIRTRGMENLIKKNPGQAAKVLLAPAKTLGVTEKVKEKLVNKLSTTVKSNNLEIDKANSLKAVDNLAEEAAIVRNLQSRIDADSLKAEDLLSVEGLISDKQFTSLKNRFMQVSTAKQKERDTFYNIGTRIVYNQSIVDVPAKTINSYFDYLVKGQSDAAGQDISLEEQASIAGMIPSNVTSFASKLDQNAKYADTSKAQDVIAAYSYIKDKGLPTLDKGFDADSTAIMEHAQLLVERGGVSPAEALVTSRDLVLNKKDEVLKTRTQEFNKTKAFSAMNIEELAASELPGAEGFFGGNRISDDAVQTFKSLIKDGYLKTGNQDTAIAYAKSLMTKTHGVSEISGTKQFMFSPPEKMFPTMAPEVLRGALLEDVSTELPEGVNAESVSVQSDNFTNGRVFVAGTQNGNQVKQNVPSWIVTYVKDIDGVEMTVPLLDANTGKPKRWTPIGSSYISNLEATQKADKEAKVQAAKLANEGFRLEQPI